MSYRDVQDKLCYDFAGYIASYINKEFDKDFPNNNTKLIKTIRTFDSRNVPIDQLPLLNVFRIKDSYRYTTDHYDSLISITYYIPFIALDKMPGAMVYVSNLLNKAINSYEQAKKFNMPRNKNQIEVNYLYNLEGSIYQEVVACLSTQITLMKLPC